MRNKAEKRKLQKLEKLLETEEFPSGEEYCSELIREIEEDPSPAGSYASEVYATKSQIELTKGNYEDSFLLLLKSIGYGLDIEKYKQLINNVSSKITKLNDNFIQFIKNLIQVDKDTPQILSMLINHFYTAWSPYQKYRSEEYKLWCEKAFKKFGLRSQLIMEELGKCYIVSEEDTAEVYEICKALGTQYTDLLYRASIFCIRNDRYDIAEKILLSIVNTQKTKYLLKPPKMDYHFPAYVALGDICCFIKKGSRMKEGIGFYQEALKLNKNCASLYNRLGDIYRRLEGQKNIEAAKDFYHKALEVDSHNTKAQYWLGNTFMSTKEYEKAFTHFSIIANEKPDFPNIDKRIAEASEKLAEKDLKEGNVEKAQAICQGLIEIDKNNIKAQMLLKQMETIHPNLPKENINADDKTGLKKYKRKYPRINTDLHADLKVLAKTDSDSMPEKIPSIVSNLSAAGAVVQVPIHKKGSLLLGILAELEIHLPGNTVPLVARGPIIRFIPSLTGVFESMSFAMHFREISPANKEKLTEHVDLNKGP
ncbi:MAG: PilZ domain-containing protein [Candidatus Auribacterota bacterium]|nr:PilZ domain-containing protein [Candidatus Auribacterota bacterium]